MTSVLRLAEIAIVVLAFVPVIRLYTRRGFLRKLNAFPALAWTSLLGVLAAATVAVIAVVFAPLLLHVIATVVLAGAAYESWRARTNYGQGRGLPPGSLKLMTTKPWTDPNFYEKESARFGPVFKMAYGTDPMICVVDLPLGLGLLRDHELELEAPPLPFNGRIPSGFIRYMDADTRPAYRTILRHTFSRTTVVERSDAIRSIVRRGLPTIVQTDGGQRNAPVHLALYEIVFAAMSDLFFGFSPESPGFDAWRRAFKVADFRRATLTMPARVTRSLAEIECMVQSRAAEVAASEGAVQPSFLRNVVEASDDEIDPTVLGNLIYVMQTATSDVTGLFHWMLQKLGTEMSWREQLRDAPRDTQSITAMASLHSRVVMETLRLEQSEYIMRRATQDIQAGEFTLPRGWLLRVCTREAHRNADVYSDPGRFDPDRFCNRKFSPTEYSPLGTGRRTCLGEHLTLHVAALFLGELASGFDWKIEGDSSPEFNGFHWRPGSGMKVTGDMV